jgi:hypothetical protein
LRRFVAGIGIGALAVVGFGTTVAFASDSYGSPGTSQASCDGQAHGSFGAFGKGQNFGASGEAWVDINYGEAGSGPNGVGANGQATGDNNSDAAAACNS